MENKKLNIAELLKDCSSGMELDCLMYEDVYFDYVDECNIIHCYIQHKTYKTSLEFSQHGTPNNDTKSKCVIFPKNKNTWEGFQRPFKDGDVIFYDDNIAIFKKWGDETLFGTYVKLYIHRTSIDKDFPLFGKGIRKETRLATEEEKQKLFNAIKANGYHWNSETKTLEKLPKFKVDNKIKLKGGDEIGYVTQVTDCYFTIKCKNNTHCWPVERQDAWELVTEKFDINSLQTFDKVLVRCSNDTSWTPQFFAYYRPNSKFPFVCTYNTWSQCIPYNEDTKHLTNTKDDCDEYYKNWNYE